MTQQKQDAGSAKGTREERWNVFAYLAGDNNLSDEMIWSLLGMQEAAQQPEFEGTVHLTAVYDPSGQGPLVYKFPTKAVIESDHFGLHPFGGIRSPLARLSGVSTFDQISHFVDQQLQDHEICPPGPPMPTMIILSGHGSGVDGMLAADRGDGLSVRELAKVLRRATAPRDDSGCGERSKIDILGLEACAMSMLELRYEIRDSVQFVLGTESFVQNNGWPYARMLRPLFKSTDAFTVASGMARSYAEYYTEYDVGGVSSDISVIALNDITTLVDSLRGLSKNLCHLLEQVECETPRSEEETRERGLAPTAHRVKGEGEATHRGKGEGEALLDALIVARWKAQSYSMDGFVDLEDWVLELLKALRGDERLEPVARDCRQVVADLQSVVKWSMYQGPAFQHSHGLSIYLPAAASRYDEGYEDLAFARDTGWSDFVKLYVQKSGRGLRKERKAGQLMSLETDVPIHGAQMPATVRTPPNGTKRQTPPNGTRLLKELDGYDKNRPRAWYRDLRFGEKPIKPSDKSSDTYASVGVLTTAK